MRSWKLQRDGLIIGISLGLLIYEVVLGGARPTALTAITTLLLSPVIMRLDEARRDNQGGDQS